MLLVFGFLCSCLSARMIFLYSREPVPFDFRLYKGVCSLYFLFLQACLALVVQGVCSLSFSIQQACLAYSLYKGVCSLCLLFSKLVLLLIWSRDFCSLFFVLLVSSFFLIYTILTFDQKKKKSDESCFTIYMIKLLSFFFCVIL
jgi:D-alanyl-lipoteichoic acid acyltransferase DltB (MBOAT superfamily)